jgi:thiol:disulfide interchange protein
MDRIAFIEQLQNNPGVVVVKYSATWCKPCKLIANHVASRAAALPGTATFLDLDLDRDTDLYSLLKAKRQVRGVPVLLAYKKGNVTPYADNSVTGADTVAIDTFFNSLVGLNAKP